MRIHLLLAWLLLLAVITTRAEEKTLTLEQFKAYPPMAEVLLFGTFHFKDAGLDGYKPKVDVDILSEERQRELQDVLAALAEDFAPTRIGIEVRGDWADRIVTKEYPAWLNDNFELKANEVYQVGFRLGKRLGHDRLYPVDVMGRMYPDLPDDLEAYAQSIGQGSLLQSDWTERYFALYRQEDMAKGQRSLAETFLAMNDPERILAGHGHYVLGDIAVGREGEYPAADSVTGWWYNRNLRIFANIRRMAKPGDRVLVIIGAGHVPIIRHAVQASPELRLVEVSDVLSR